MPYCDPRVFPEKDQAVYDGFIQKLGLFGSFLIRNGYAVSLFGSDIGIDPLSIKDLQSSINNGTHISSSHCLTSETVSSIEELLFQMSLMDYVVTCRYHGVIFAHLLNKPVLAISHHPKVAALMTDIGLAKYCVDIRGLELSLLTDVFVTLVSNGEEIKGFMADRLSCYKRELTEQFDKLFPPKCV
jgi:polysaccharide pyruvyl transferase WcaK-like protein